MLEKCDANAEKMLLMRESTGQKGRASTWYRGGYVYIRRQNKVES